MNSRERNRLNQAASRARTRSRIEALEARLSAYEASGIQASIEVQRAARSVTEENAALRALLHHLGVDEQTVREYIDGHRKGLSTTAEANVSSDVVRKTLGVTARSNLCGGLGAKRRRVQSQPSANKARTGLEDEVQTERSQPVRITTKEAGVEQNVAIEQHVHPVVDARPLYDTPHNNSHTLDQYQPSNKQTANNPIKASLQADHPLVTSPAKATLAPDETTCEDAARIIASLRGTVPCFARVAADSSSEGARAGLTNGSPSSEQQNVWRELGCGSQVTCTVKNSRIFELAE